MGPIKNKTELLKFSWNPRAYWHGFYYLSLYPFWNIGKYDKFNMKIDGENIDNKVY